MAEKNKKSPFSNAGIYLNTIYTLFTFLFLFFIYQLAVMPDKYFYVLALILILPWCYLMFVQTHKRIKKKRKMHGRIIIIVLIILLGVGNWYLIKAGSFLSAITGADMKVTKVSVVIPVNSEASDLSDLKKGQFGVITTDDRAIQEKAIDDIRKEIKQEPKTVSYRSYKEYGEDLLEGNVDAILLNEGARGIIEENNPSFKDDTRVLLTFTYKTKVNDVSKNVNVTKEPFNIYVSGLDVFGDVSTTSRSDVNMMVSVNPKTKQILLVSIPRDFYVKQPCQNGQADKLTHSGIYGTDCTVESFEGFAGIKMNYYARVNFSGVIDIIDAIGGIEVNNPQAFTGEAGNFFFEKGDIQLNGEQALCFARERHSFIDEDVTRGQNQMRVISAVIHKAASPAIITNFSGILNALQNCVETNMTQQEMSSLVKLQLDKNIQWDIRQISLGGYDGNEYSPANGLDAYVMIPVQETVTNALQIIDKLHAGELITDADIQMQADIVEQAKYAGEQQNNQSYSSDYE